MKYFAHSSPSGTFHELALHLKETGKRAEVAAEKLGLRSWGQALGLLHDLGKYSAEFQERVRGAPQSVDHSTFGARTAEEQYGKLGRLLAYCAAGHHGGLPNGIDDGSGDSSTLLQRLARSLPDAFAWRQEIELPLSVEKPNVTAVRPERLGFALAHSVRMAFSALVDADHLDTEQWSAGVAGYRVARGDWPSLGRIALRLNEHMSAFKADTPVRQIRAEILAAARKASALPPGLFSMTVPTGGGKTLASVAWALGHAHQHNLDRIIIVIPFTSIIEQTASVLRTALGDLGHVVIEHHSSYKELSDDEKRMRQGHGATPITWASDHRVRRASENWDARLVVTTNVQFYESLFANKPSQCRKLHNIARSVIIIDEAQSLPPAMLVPCVAMLEEMTRGYGTSILLCTATQPAIVEVPERPAVGLLGEGLRNVREIAPAGLHDRLLRVIVERAGTLTDQQLFAALARHEQGLVIVNTRSHARDLYIATSKLRGAAHLSALMCPAHRTVKLDAYKQQLGDGEPLRLISTPVIEAGVDIDFPRVWRAVAGLASIAQAAGRCNREGQRDVQQSVVTVFEPAHVNPPSYLADDIAAYRFAAHYHADLLSPEAVEDYFSDLYRKKMQKRQRRGLDRSQIMERLEQHRNEFLFSFADVARDFSLIDDYMLPLLIPYDDQARLLINELYISETPALLLRRLQRYIVQIPETKHASLVSAGDVRPVADDTDIDLWALTNMTLYRDDLGLDA